MADPGHNECSSSTGLSRRDFILSMLVGVLTSGALRAAGSPTAPAWVRRLAGAPAASRHLGAAYLHTHPDERDAARLTDLLQQALLRHVDQTTTADVDTLSAAAVTMIAQEYIDAQVVDVDRWVLSVSEARLYALLTLIESAAE